MRDPLAGGNVFIRQAAAADIATIIPLAQRIWRAHYPGIISTEQIEFMLASIYAPERITAEMTEGAVIYFVAEQDGTSVGFAAVGPTSDEPTAKLHKLYVLPEHQGRGIGRALMKTVLARASAMGRKDLILAVNKRNEKAIAAYTKWGFQQRGPVMVDIGGGFVMDDYILVIAVPKADQA